MKTLKENIVPVCFICLAGLLAMNNIEGWGWCIFCALITTN